VHYLLNIIIVHNKKCKLFRIRIEGFQRVKKGNLSQNETKKCVERNERHTKGTSQTGTLGTGTRFALAACISADVRRV